MSFPSEYRTMSICVVCIIISLPIVCIHYRLNLFNVEFIDWMNSSLPFKTYCMSQRLYVFLCRVALIDLSVCITQISLLYMYIYFVNILSCHFSIIVDIRETLRQKGGLIILDAGSLTNFIAILYFYDYFYQKQQFLPQEMSWNMTFRFSNP
jgi:hypothetical protein